MPERIAQLLDAQATSCARLGSPLYGGLLHYCAQDVRAGGLVAAVLAGHEGDPADAALALRLLGAVHRIVLEGRGGGLARFYPSVGGSADAAAAWPHLRALLGEHADEVRRGLQQAPQTNEVGRAAALLGGLLHVAAGTGLPVRLLELGTSAGLNLRVDAFRVEADDGVGWGPPGSPVVLRRAWRGAPLPPLDAPLRIVERLGGDLAPLDPLTPEGELTLRSYVWADQLDRLERLRGAIELARRRPAPVVRASAAEFAHEVDVRAGVATVLWHSVVWQYLPADEQAAVAARLQQVGGQASGAAPLAYLRLEPRPRRAGADPEFLVSLARWPGGEEQVLGAAHPHGVPVTWA